MRRVAGSVAKLILLLILVGMVSIHAQEDGQSSGQETGLSDRLIEAAVTGTYATRDSHLLVGVRSDTYERYRQQFADVPAASDSIVIDPTQYVDASDDVVIVDSSRIPGASGAGQVLSTGEASFVEWEVAVEVEGLYHIRIDYFPVQGRNSSIERALQIDGELPFFGAGHALFSRVWIDAEEIGRDNRGNDIRPRQAESPMWRTGYFQDNLGYYTEPYEFYFAPGTHRIRMESIREPALLRSVMLTRKPSVSSYQQYLSDLAARGLVPGDHPASLSRAELDELTIKVQGEDAVLKSDPMLYPIFDRSSPISEPYHHSKIRLNTIGGDRWKLPGQWVSWEIDVPRDGFYTLSLRARQNLVHGLSTNRRLMIDGEVPFDEMNAMEFPYNTGWQAVTPGYVNDLGEEEPYSFYLTAGTHLITMETTLGDLAPILRRVENSVFALNYAYRKILMLTGPEPDPYRDYLIDQELPDVIRIFREQSAELDHLGAMMEEYAGERSHAAPLFRLSYQLTQLADRPHRIPRGIKELKTNVGSLATWIFTTREQPVEIDYLAFQPPGARPIRGRAGFFRRAWHTIRAFFASFFEDYESVGNTYSNTEALTVWVLTGRDQAQILKQMADDSFSPEYDIGVNVKLVLPEVLLPATVAGLGPDVAVNVAATEPINYAIRNAVTDLSQFSSYEEIAARFHPSALVPFTYQDGVFALPETQEFLILFYRTDIFDELGLEVPDTWDDMFALMPDLQKAHMEFVVPVRQTLNNIQIYGGSLTYEMFLFQLQGQLYQEDGIAVDIDSDIGIEAFRRWTDLFVNYKLPEQYDFRNRFRVGDVPIGIASYVEYNALEVFAPEIRGLWSFAPVPGTVQPDGTIDRSVPATGLGSIMLAASDNQDAAWQFLTWWTGISAQERYGLELESILGPAARYPTANQEALARLPWPVADQRNLAAQWEWVVGVPEVPGSYYLPRHLDNAWRRVFYNGWNHRETLLEYARLVNEEITAKRSEFGLETMDDRREISDAR
jgi:ABC-type glycerol-3-phosphate transport system substrate-binding protein